ncbi:MAG TPA: EAL domain-containing protein [Solirubrobacteraceae bacterium]|nr:EAL domain-containing protein [Solirubrobacteraceae bacterium]
MASAQIGSPVAPAAVVIADRERRILHVEGNAFAAHGLRIDSWIGQRIDEVLPAEAVPILAPRYDAAFAGAPQSFEYRAQDDTREYVVQLVPVPDAAGIIGSVVAVMQDVTERAQMISDLARSEGRLREAERLVGVGSWELVVATGEITYSAGLAELMELQEGQRLDKHSHLELVHPADRDQVAAIGEECVRHGSTSCEYRIVLPSGATRTLALHAEAVTELDGRREHLRGAVLDVTAEREADRQRLAAAHLFREGFDAAPIGMALTDPVEGRCVRVNDAMCRQLGRTREQILGGSLVGLATDENQPVLRRAREEMLRGNRESFKAEMRYLRGDGSEAWGLLHWTPVRREDGSVEAFHSQLVDITDRKERESRLEHDVEEALWLGRIRDALDEDRFVLYAQPIVDLMTGQTVQHELLLRMLSEDGEIIAPCAFLPAAERYGLISEIDRWVIRQAVQIAEQGIPTEFNLSGRSIGDPDVLRELATALQQSGVDPSLLVVEVTETAFVGQTEAGRAFAERVRELGCRLALDDFGTGFSSLQYLKHLPADHLKIDIDFVRDLTSNETDARVVRGIVALAREFHQTTIAEGVEDEATLLMLRDLGVDLAQGYLFGRPAPMASSASGGRVPATCASRSPVSQVDQVDLVAAAFDAFARRDVDGMLSRCHPDFVLRSVATAKRAERSAPYRGHEGILAYMRDVATVWDELSLTLLTFRQAQDSVIGFGRVQGRTTGERFLGSIMWMVRVRGDLISSIEVFQAAGGPSLSDSQIERLQDGTARPAVTGEAPARAAGTNAPARVAGD